jgi:hypothetical protein
MMATSGPRSADNARTLPEKARLQEVGVVDMRSISTICAGLSATGFHSDPGEKLAVQFEHSIARGSTRNPQFGQYIREA